MFKQWLTKTLLKYNLIEDREETLQTALEYEIYNAFNKLAHTYLNGYVLYSEGNGNSPRLSVITDFDNPDSDKYHRIPYYIQDNPYLVALSYFAHCGIKNSSDHAFKLMPKHYYEIKNEELKEKVRNESIFPATFTLQDSDRICEILGSENPHDHTGDKEFMDKISHLNIPLTRKGNKKNK